MSVAERVTAHLPYLRRFARAVTGSQKSGDAYVVSTLEAILADPTIFSQTLPPRAALYRTFLKILGSVAWNNERPRDAPVPGLEAAQRNLEALTPKARQAFLLVSVEELELTPDGMDFLLKSDAESKIFPSLRTIKVAPFIAPTNIDMVLPFLHWRREMGTPIATFDLELHPLAGFPINFAFLEEMAGMKVLWKAGQDSQSYTCGSGDPEVLNFKYDPLQLMYEIRKL